MKRQVMFIVLFLTSAWAANAQAVPAAPVLITPRVDVGAGFNYVRANAPPGGCPCFNMMGGFASMALHFNRTLSLAAEVTGGHSNNISSLGQDLTLITYLAGPRVQAQHGRLVPFAQVLFGAAHGGDSYFPNTNGGTSSSTSWSMSAGGGIDISLSQRWAVRPVTVQYLRTAFPNGASNTQNQISLGAGVVMKFGSIHESMWHRPMASAPLPPPPPPLPLKLAFACSAGSSTVTEGDVVDVSGSVNGSMAEPVYSWSTTGGVVQGGGENVHIGTTGLPPGDYRVMGHVVSSDNSSVPADCVAVFHVKKRPEIVAAVVPARANNEAAFHENVPDVLFDYDKAEIRPDAIETIRKDAAYLNTHPDVNIQIGGFSDERGTQQYNLALGLKRASAVRDRLIAAGISGDRIRVVSYGKMVQVCTSGNETCFQQNRRAAISPLP